MQNTFDKQIERSVLLGFVDTTSPGSFRTRVFVRSVSYTIAPGSRTLKRSPGHDGIVGSVLGGGALTGGRDEQYQTLEVNSMFKSCFCAVKFSLVVMALLPLAVCSGCTGTGKVTVLVAADADTAKSLIEEAAAQANVAVADIASLKVTVNSVILDRLDGTQTELLTAPQDVDLISLADVSALLTATEASAGIYTKVRLGIENPRIALASDPDTALSGVDLAVDSPVLVDTQFVVLPNTNANLVLTFSGLNLVEADNGGYTLTPELDATVSVVPVPVSNEGTVVSVDTATSAMVLTIGGADITVNIAGAAVYLPGDTDTPTGTVDSLVADALVQVEGSVDTDGVIAATKVTVLSTPAT